MIWNAETFKEKAMRNVSTTCRTMKLAVCSMILAFATGCLPDNFWSDTLGEVVNDLVISTVKTALSGTGLDL